MLPAPEPAALALVPDPAADEDEGDESSGSELADSSNTDPRVDEQHPLTAPVPAEEEVTDLRVADPISSP